MIRAAKEEDRAQIVELCLATFRGVSIDENIEDKFQLPANSWQEKKRAAILEDLKHLKWVFVAEVEGEVVGFITTRLFTDTGRIANLGVDPAYRGRGLGKALIAHALDFFKEKGFKLARIETMVQNEIGQKLYPKMGFVEVARQIHYAMEL